VAVLPDEAVVEPSFAPLDPGRPTRPLLPSGATLGGALRWTLAAASLGTAVLHFGHSPSHFDSYWAYGAFLVAVAWLQVAAAVGILSRPSRAVLLGTIALNVVVIAAWVLSLTVGVGFGPNASSTRAVGYPDVLATALEVVVVLGCGVLLAHPARLEHRVRTSWLTPVAVGISVVLVAGSAAYALTPGFTGTGTATTSPATVVTPGGAKASAASSAGLTGTTPCEKAGPPASEGQILDSSGHFHRGPYPQVPIDEATRLTLEAQQAQARAVVAKYPTVADAERAGYRKSTVYVPCIGAHYTNGALAGKFDPFVPAELLYDGTQPDSRIVGLSYLVFSTPLSSPAGFAGPNDRWHQHTFNGGLCINRDGLVIGSETTSAEDCAARGGHKAPLTNAWMLHDWVVPGFECSWGVFAAECPELGGRAGASAWQS
jgi:hypothetical protein